MNAPKYISEEWTTFDKKRATLDTIDHQHLSNSYWFLKVVGKATDHQLWQILQEISIRFEGNVLPYRPHPRFVGEHAYLRSHHMVDADGNIIYKGEIIGFLNIQLELGE